MSSINILSKEISELIAAGEVIEKPSSVIKELVENSIDSGANHITVEIKNGGRTYMRVTDDGCGISYKDVPKAFLRHATSKITTKADLDNIYTLGFRGEALASVAAVSKVELMTKPDNQDGTTYEIHGGTEISYEKSSCPDGTTIIIRDLFYNIPARRKFMKKDVTEANAISQVIQKITLSHPEIAFKFIRDNRMEFNSSGDGELFSAIYAAYGREFAHDMMKIDFEKNNIHITGYIVKPLYARTNRSFQNFFVNGRYIHSKVCSAAIENAYENMLMKGKFPACVLMININPSLIDVNIHPAKAEVRFADDKAVSDAIFFAVENAMVRDGLIYEFELKPDENEREFVEEIFEKPKSSVFTIIDELYKEEDIPERMPDITDSKPQNPDETAFTEPVQPAEILLNAQPAIHEKTEISDSNIFTEEKKSEPDEPQQTLEGFNYINRSLFEDSVPVVQQDKPEKSAVKKEVPAIHVIGEALGLYVIAETDDKKIVIIDKHAAHERIIFERLKSRNCRQYMQMLMTEVKLLLPEEEISAMEENTELLADMGFVFDFSEKPFVIAKAVPTFIDNTDIESIVSEITENLRLQVHNPQSHILDDMLHTVACKSAVKAKDKSSPEELQSLAEQVYYNDKIRHCPHGRPVMFIMTENNIAHQFRRT